jgi:hypothetical protein
MVAAHGGFTFNKKDEQNKVITANPLTLQLFVVPVVLKGFVERIIKIRPFIFFLQNFQTTVFIFQTFTLQYSHLTILLSILVQQYSSNSIQYCLKLRSIEI